MADTKKAPGGGDESVKRVEAEATADEKKAASADEKAKLLQRMKEVSDAIHSAKEVLGTKDLEELSKALEEINGKLLTWQPQPQGHGGDGSKKDEERFFPQAQSKREELASLLTEIDRTLKLLNKQPQPGSSEDVAQKTKKKLSAAVTGCNPLKLLSSSSQQRNREQGGGGGGQEGEDEPSSLKLLVRLAQHVLEPEQYYEWTTSYVDETRIYGWDKEADEVAKALVSTGDDDGDLFRAAAITGVHGSGKTTLAQKVFIHDLAKDHFPIRLWVCVGPADSEDRFNLLYRMLDNLGHDTNWIEDVVVDGAQVVQKQREATLSKDVLDELRKTAAGMAANKGQNKTQQQQDAAAAGEDETERNYKQLLKDRVDDSKAPGVQASKIGVLLYILHTTLAKTGYLIVFDDIRVYGGDEWYSNLTLPPPPSPDTEWHERLAYGLPKTTGSKHRSAVLVTCRKEDDARTMVRTGRVFRPPRLDTGNGWKLFEREYTQAKKDYDAKKKNKEDGGGGDDKLFKYLEKMKVDIVEKCLGLPVAIIEAAKGYACSDLQPLPEQAANKPASEDKQTSDKGIQTEQEPPSKLQQATTAPSS